MGVLEWLGSTGIEWEIIVTALLAATGVVATAVFAWRSQKTKSAQELLAAHVEDLTERVAALETRAAIAEKRVVRYRAYTLKLQAHIWERLPPPPPEPDVDPEAD